MACLHDALTPALVAGGVLTVAGSVVTVLGERRRDPADAAPALAQEAV